MTDPVNVVLCFVGLFLAPKLTFCIILMQLGHPILGIIAFLGPGEAINRESYRRK
jgi:hypothetical protein